MSFTAPRTWHADTEFYAMKADDDFCPSSPLNLHLLKVVNHHIPEVQARALPELVNRQKVVVM